MNDMEYELNELYKELTGKICTEMNSDAVESMREAYQSNIEETINDLNVCFANIIDGVNVYIQDIVLTGEKRKDSDIKDIIKDYMKDFKC